MARARSGTCELHLSSGASSYRWKHVCAVLDLDDARSIWQLLMVTTVYRSTGSPAHGLVSPGSGLFPDQPKENILVRCGLACMGCHRVDSFVGLVWFDGFHGSSGSDSNSKPILTIACALCADPTYTIHGICYWLSPVHGPVFQVSGFFPNQPKGM